MNVSWSDTFKSAPIWSSLLVATWVVALLGSSFTLPPDEHGKRGFTINRESLDDRPDRTRCMATFFGAFFAVSLQISLSARKLKIERGLPWDLP